MVVAAMMAEGDGCDGDGGGGGSHNSETVKW